MAKLLSLVYSYYENAEMYLRQLQEWESYSDRVKRNVSFFVTDDCSPRTPLSGLRSSNKINLHRYEITKKAEWNWLACRNIGSKYAKSRWVLVTDMDHLIRSQDMEKLIDFLRSPDPRMNYVYLFTRKDAPDYVDYKPHNDSFMMTKKMYWRIGGYDEELSGHYGTSGRYRNRAFSIAERNVRLDIPLIRYPREIISDASTTDFVRKGEGRDPDAIRRIEKKKAKEGRTNEILTMSFPHRRL